MEKKEKAAFLFLYLVLAQLGIHLLRYVTSYFLTPYVYIVMLKNNTKSVISKYMKKIKGLIQL